MINASNTEKERIFLYEVWMWRETCRRLIQGSKPSFEQNLLIESLAVHTRILVDFFYMDQKTHPDDLIAQDLFPKDIDWKKVRPLKTKMLEEAKKKANKQLAHLSLQRIELEKTRKKGWSVSDIFKDMENVIKTFMEQRKGSKTS